MERITKNVFISTLQAAAAVGLVWGGWIEREKVFNDVERIKDYTPEYNRKVEKASAGRVVFTLNDGGQSVLDMNGASAGREWYKENDILIQLTNYTDYKPNICIYKIK